MQKRTIESLVAAFFLLVCSHDGSLAATTFKSAISPGDLGPPIVTPAPIASPVIEFSNYVSACKSELEFDSIPQFDCRDIEFRNDNPAATLVGDFTFTDDFVAHQKINYSVDALFACRWVRPGVNGEITAATGEMLVHNRVNGKTCFFQLKNISTAIQSRPFIQTTNPPSPTNQSASDFWDSPTNVAKTKCTGCHSAGPYIASGPIVKALAQYGLINDGHDTFGTIYSAVGSFGPQFDEDARLMRQSDTGCAKGCHVIGATAPAGTKLGTTTTDAFGHIVIPSIQIALTELLGAANDGYDNFAGAERMPPNDPYSAYRWVNLDTPGGVSGDWERLKELKVEFPQFVCKNGVTEVQTHVVDSIRRMSTADFPDVLRTFNLLDGLVCRNADQADGHRCGDYQTRYHCPNGHWTPWSNTSTPDGTGEVESRDNFPGLCSNPTEIQARRPVEGFWWSGFGPPDRLSEFDLNGVVCKNSQQPSGQCNDYTVRFICAQ